MNIARLNEIKERTSMSTYFLYNYAPLDGKALKQISKAGIRKIELLESPQQYDMSDKGSMGYIFDMCRDAGISIIAYHSHFINPTGIESEEALSKLTDVCKRQIETMREAGGNIWASHTRVADRAAYRMYEGLLRFVEGTQVKLAVENFTLSGTGVQDRMSFLHELDHPQLGFILDIGHVRDGAGKNPMTLPGGPAQILQQCKDKLIHLHLHGFKNGVDHHPPLCDGDEIQWEEIFRTLPDIDYQGYFNFEPRGLPEHKDTLPRVSRMPETIANII